MITAIPVDGMLVVRPAIRPDDTIDSFLLRTTGLNVLGDPARLVGEIGLARSFRRAPTSLAGLSRIAGIPEQRLASAAPWPVDGGVRHGGRAVARRTLASSCGRICPVCVSEGKDYDPVWDIRTSTACTLHHVVLLDACPACGARLGFRRPAPGICRCGTSLLGNAAPADDASLEMSGLVVRAFRDEASRPSLDLLVHIAWLAGCRELGGRSTMIADPAMDVCVRIVKIGLPVVADWPKGLVRWLSGTRRETAGRTGLSNELPMIERLAAGLSSDDAGLLFDAAAAVVDAGSSVPPRRGTRLSSPGSALRATDAARELGTTQPRLVRFVEEGRLRGFVASAGGRRFAVAERRDVRRLAHRCATGLERREAAAALGIAIRRLDTLLDAGILNAFDGFGIRSGRRLVGSQEAVRLTRRLEAVTSRAAAPVDLLTLSSVPRLHRLQLADVLKKVLSGRLPCFVMSVDGPVLDRYGCSKVELLRSARTGLTVRHVARRLAVPTRLVPRLVEVGCLRKGPEGIEPASVEAFDRRFGTGRILAARYRTSTAAMLRRLNEAGVLPIVPSDACNGISSVWDIERAEVGLASADRSTAERTAPKRSRSRHGKAS